jgi:pilus assembly protein CpaC
MKKVVETSIMRSLSVMLFALLIAHSAWSDEPVQRGSIGNLPSIGNVIPKLRPRPLGRLPSADQQRAPISDFAQSLAGGDGVIEVFIGQSRILTTNAAIADRNGVGVIASGDPTVIDFDVLPNPRLIRILGKRVGVTDLTFVTATGESITYDVHVVFDLPLIQTQMQALFPDATFSLSQLREHVVIKGEARSPSQVSQIVETLKVYLGSLQVEQQVQPVAATPDDFPRPRGSSPRDAQASNEPSSDGNPDAANDDVPSIAFDGGKRPMSQAQFHAPRVINLMRVPGPQQVMLKVTIAELNRVALRRLATNLTIGSEINNFLSSIQTDSGNLVGVFGDGDFSFLMDALRQNSVTTILAQPNLVTMSGHTSRFQSGGEFPVPVPQAGGGNGAITIQYKPFGVQLAFTPLIEADGAIRLTVEPEVSDIDPNLSVSTGERSGTVPGIRTRNASTTVQMREGQTLAIAGLLNNASRARTSRVPLLGDVPYIGALFTNNEAESREDELLIVVTPHLVSPINGEQPACLPGQEVQEPNDWEFYLLNRIEGRTGVPHRATTNWDDPLGHIRKWQLEHTHGCGPIGFSE